MSTILLLSGRSLDRLGVREPEIYGTATLDDLVADARDAAAAGGHELEHLQSAEETVLVEAIGATTADAIVVNAAHFTHTSHAIAEALAAFAGPVVELHITNPHAREEWRRTSILSPSVDAIVAGFGRTGYRLAVDGVCDLLEQR